MVAAQRARRVLDRLVGYKISPLLWDKVRRGLSAGRVQSVALKLVCDREREIEQFVPEEYWNVFARLAGPQPPEFEAKLLKKGGETITVAQRGASRRRSSPTSSGATWTVVVGHHQGAQAQRAPPFITSKLQQTARFPVKKTMMLAQQLYEGGIEIPGADAAASSPTCEPTRCAWRTRRWPRCASTSRTTFGDDYLPEKPNVYKTKADAQDAHEAIRPTSLQHDPETVRPYLTPDQYSLYRLIWNRFVASQMPPATFDETTVDVTAGDYVFRVKGTVPKFAGWMATYGLTPGETEQKEPAGRPGKTRRRRRCRVGRAAAARRRRSPRAEGAAAGAEVHAAAAALLRSDAREGARGKRHRPAEHLRVDHRRAAGSRIRQQDRGPLQAVGARRDHHRSADQELRRHHRRRVHAQPRGRSRQDRAGQDRLRQDARRRSTRSSRRTSRAPARR